MISIVLYGRNDSYGYNLHKRAALGLNTMAEMLSDPDDEILFVDYNTPDDHPTFPEAIADTLTAVAAARLRILRVRPDVHAQVSARTHLLAIEPIARNVGIRRSNPANRWILSTNTDMIFVPRTATPLSVVAGGLNDGFYHLPRFELPESLWEGFDRRDPAGVIERVRVLGRTLFLNQIVYGAEFIKYDGPGDFQLMLRRDLFRIHGFDEEMILGWHVDSNIAKRLHLLYGTVGDAVVWYYGYHCDHTRQVTPAHQHRAVGNDYARFVEQVVAAPLPAQAASWGCASHEIEEVRLTRSAHAVYLDGLRSALHGGSTDGAQPPRTPDGAEPLRDDARRVLPFLADLFASAPRQWTLAWVGGRADVFQLFCRLWVRCGFTGRVLIADWSSPLLAADASPGVSAVDHAAMDAAADVLVVDFGSLPGDLRVDGAVDVLVRDTFARLVAAERARIGARLTPRRFICLDTVDAADEAVVLGEIAAAATPFASRVRHGFVKRRAESYGEAGATEPAPSWLPAMVVGQSGERDARGIRAPFGRRGVVMHGPHTPLPAGRYRLDITVRMLTLWSLVACVRPIVMDVAAGNERLLQRRFRFLILKTIRTTFSVSGRQACHQPIYLRLFRGRFVDFLVTGISLLRLEAGAPGDEAIAEMTRLIAGHTPTQKAT